MEIEGKIIYVLPEQGGVSARTGNEWKSQDYVVETHDQYPKKCCFRVFGADKIAQFAIKTGDEVRVSLDIDSHEYQGRWFNDIRAWRVDHVDPAAAQAGAQGVSPMGGGSVVSPAPTSPIANDGQSGENAVDDLPF
jgi:hypothetical protein